MKGMEEHDDMPDKTLSELKNEEAEDEQSNVDWDEAAEEFKNDREELFRLAEIMFTASLLGEMFNEDILTLREYFVLTEYLEMCERNCDMSLM